MRLLAIACVVAALIVGATPPVFAEALTVVRVGLAPADDVTPLLYAQRNGLFARAGLDVRVASASSGTAMAAAVIAGTYDIGKSSLTAVLNAHARNVPLALIAPCGIYDSKAPYEALMVRSDAPIRSAKDLDGRVIGVPALNDLNELVTMAWVDRHGGDSRSLRFVELPVSAAAAAIEERRIDAAVLTYPALAAALASHKTRALGDAYSALGDRYAFSAYFTTRDWAASHADVVRRFARVLAEAATYTNAHHAETAPLLSEFTSIPVDVIAHMTRSIAGTSLDPAELQPIIDAAAKYRFIPRAFPARELIADEVTR